MRVRRAINVHRNRRSFHFRPRTRLLTRAKRLRRTIAAFGRDCHLRSIILLLLNVTIILTRKYREYIKRLNRRRTKEKTILGIIFNRRLLRSILNTTTYRIRLNINCTTNNDSVILPCLTLIRHLARMITRNFPRTLRQARLLTRRVRNVTINAGLAARRNQLESNVTSIASTELEICCTLLTLILLMPYLLLA